MAFVSPVVFQVSLSCLLVSYSVIGPSSFPPGDSFGKVTDAARYAPDLPRLYRILLIPNVHFFTFFPDMEHTTADTLSDKHRVIVAPHLFPRALTPTSDGVHTVDVTNLNATNVYVLQLVLITVAQH